MDRSARTLTLLLALAAPACSGADQSADRTEPAMPAAATAETTVPPAPTPSRLPPDAASAPPATEPGVVTVVPVGETETAPEAPPAPATGNGPAAASAPPSAPSSQSSSAADDILERAERTYAGLRSMQAGFVQEVYVPLLDTTQRSRGTMYHRAPDRFLMRFSDPAGDVVVADGQFIWMYYPSTDDRQVMRAVLSPRGQQVDLHKEFLSNATIRFSATRTGSESIGGRRTHALTLVPRGPSPYRQVRLWIDAENSLVRRFEITEENGSVRKLEMQDIRLNPDLAADLFQFEPPAGVQVHDF